MEAMLAAYGSGAAKVSHDRGLRVQHRYRRRHDQAALIEHGRVLETAAIHIGGRLLVADAEGRITRLDPQGRELARQAGFDLQLGGRVHRASWIPCANGWPNRSAWRYWASGASISPSRSRSCAPSRASCFPAGSVNTSTAARSATSAISGGGLGRALAKRLDRLPGRLLPAGECIRATAFGASEYSVQLSGNTVYVSEPGALLPRKNLPGAAAAGAARRRDRRRKVAAAIRAHFDAFDIAEGETEVALAFKWRGEPRSSACRVGSRHHLALRATIEQEKPIYLVLEGDVAHTLGAILKED